MLPLCVSKWCTISDLKHKSITMICLLSKAQSYNITIPLSKAVPN